MTKTNVYGVQVGDVFLERDDIRHGNVAYVVDRVTPKMAMVHRIGWPGAVTFRVQTSERGIRVDGYYGKGWAGKVDRATARAALEDNARTADYRGYLAATS